MAYFQTFTGRVEDNNDPDKLGRLQVLVPDFADTPIWIPPSSFPSSSSGGLFLLPDIGDVVHVRCENGDPSYPVWDFGFWLEGNLIPQADASYPESLVLKFGDNYIELNKENTKIIITNADSTMMFEDGILVQATSLTQNTDNDTIEDSGGNHQITASEIHLNGTGNSGMVKVDALVSRLNDLENKFNALLNNYKTHIHPHPQGPTSPTTTASGLQSATTTSKSQLENPKVKH